MRRFAKIILLVVSSISAEVRGLLEQHCEVIQRRPSQRNLVMNVLKCILVEVEGAMLKLGRGGAGCREVE